MGGSRRFTPYHPFKDTLRVVRIDDHGAAWRSIFARCVDSLAREGRETLILILCACVSKVGGEGGRA